MVTISNNVLVFNIFSRPKSPNRRYVSFYRSEFLSPQFSMCSFFYLIHFSLLRWNSAVEQ